MSTEITITSTTIDINVTESPITIEAPSGAYPLPTSVYSVFGRTGNVVAAEGDYTLTQLAGVTITSPSAGQALVYNGTSWVNNTETYVGTVTSVAATVPTGLTITGSPITTSGTLAFGLQTGYSIPTTASQTTWDAAYNDKINSAAVTGTTTKTLTLNQQDGGTVTASWTDDNTDAVTSVFGRTGAVVSANGDYTTTQVTEGTNLYYTDVRARASNSFVAGSGAYNSTTGVITIPTDNSQIANSSAYITLTGLSATSPLSYVNTTGVFSISQANTTTNGYLSSFDWNTFNNKQIALTFGNLTSSDITVTGGTGAIIGAGSTLTLATVNTNTGTFGSITAIPVVTVNGKGLVTAMSTVAVSIPSGSLSFIGDVTGTGTTGSNTTLTLATVNTNVGAYGDSITVPTITVNAKGLVTAASQTAIPTATSSVTGLLTLTDWSTFNSKQNQLNGTGFVKVTGTTVSYDNSTYLTTISGIAAGGELSGTYASPSLVNSAVTGKVLTGVNITGGTIADTDSILTAFGKVQNQINGLIGGSIYKGTWNASTNTPALASGVGTAGNYYIVSVAGTTNLDGITDWQVGDWVIYQGTEWEKVDNTDAVVSVNGFTGAVSLTTSNISEGSNLYYTDVRARTSISGSTGISYNSTNGVITNSAPDQTVSLTASTGISTSGTYPSFTITNTAPDQTVALTSGTGISATGTYPNFTITNTAPDQVVALTQGGTTTISGTYPNFTISSADQYVGTVTSVGITESSAALSITGSPVTTSGNINIGFAGSPTQYVAGDGSLVTFPTIVTQAQNLVAEVYNNTGATLTKGTIVYINGGHGNLPTVTKAIATSDPTSAQTFGFINVDLTNNNNGYVTIIGRLENIDTQAYANGTQLYLSGTTAGTYTSTKPQAPIHLVYVAIVVRSHPTQGVLEVKIQNGVEIDEIHDVQITSLANGNILQYSSADSLWHNVAGTTTNIAEGTNLYYTDTRARTSISTTATGLTYTSGTGVLSLTAGYVIPTTSSATNWDTAYTNRITSATSPLSIAANVISIAQATTSTSGYLSSTDWTTFNNKQNALTNPVTGTGTTNYHTKFTGTSTIGNSLIFDNGTNVGIGTASPDTLLHLSSTTDTSILRLERNSVTITSGQSYGQVQWEGQDASTGAAGVRSSIDVLSNGILGETNLVFRTSGSNFNANLDRLTIDSSGNLGLGVTPSAWSSAYKAFQLNTQPAIWGSTDAIFISVNQFQNTSGSNRYIVNGFATQYRQDGGQHQFYTAPSGTAGNAISFTQAMTLASTGNLLVGTTTDAGYKLDVNGQGRFLTTSTTPLILQTTGGNCGIQILTSSTTHNWLVAAQYSAANTFEITPSTTVGGQTYSSPVFKITNGGAATFSSTVQTGGNISVIATDPIYITKSTNSASGSTLSRIISYGTHQPSSTYYPATYIDSIKEDTLYATKLMLKTTDTSGNVINALTLASTGAATFSNGITVNGSNAADNVAVISAIRTDETGRYIKLIPSGSDGVISGARIDFAHATNYALFTGATNYKFSSSVTATSFIPSGATIPTNGMYLSAANTLNFATASTNRVVISSSGNVGIGTASPLDPLQVNGNFRLYTSNGDGNELRGIFNVGGAADPLSFSMYKADATTIGTFITADGASYFNGGNVLIGTTTDNNSKLLLTQSGTVNCLRINSTSASFNNYGIYFDAARNTTNDTFRAFAYYNSGAGAFKFYVLDSGNIYSTSTSITIISSDQKLKTDIRDYNKGLSEVLAMKPRIYKRKDNLEVDEIGFIAQEMGAALEGSMIESDKDENGEAIMTYKVEWYPLLVKAIQELSAQNQDLKSRLDKAGL